MNKLSNFEIGPHFATDDEIKASTYIIDMKDDKIAHTGIPLTYMGDDKLALSYEELHTFIIGESGSGKSRRIIIPSIDILSKGKAESLVITDPKGELYKKTNKLLKQRGYKIFKLDLQNPFNSDHWNPFQRVIDLYNKGYKEKAQATVLLREIIGSLKAGVHSEQDQFWENIATKCLFSLATIILQNGRMGDLTIRNLTSCLDQLFTKGEYIESLIANLPSNSFIKQTLYPFLLESSAYKSSILGVASTMLDPFNSNPLLFNLFDSSTIDLEAIGKENVALFLIFPDSSTQLYPIISLFIKQLYTTLLSVADSKENGMLDNRVTFILDEFANIPQIPNMDCFLTAGRSRGIRFVLVCQNIEQLHNNYGSYTADTIMSNCRIWIYMSSRSFDLLKKFENLLGYKRSKYTSTLIPLCSVQDLQHFKMGEVLILNDRLNPIRGWLPDYSTYCKDVEINYNEEADKCLNYDGEPTFSLISYLENVCPTNTIDLDW